MNVAKRRLMEDNQSMYSKLVRNGAASIESLLAEPYISLIRITNILIHTPLFSYYNNSHYSFRVFPCFDDVRMIDGWESKKNSSIYGNYLQKAFLSREVMITSNHYIIYASHIALPLLIRNHLDPRKGRQNRKAFTILNAQA